MPAASASVAPAAPASPADPSPVAGAGHNGGLRLPELILEEGRPPRSPDRRPILLDPDASPIAFGWRDAAEHWLDVPDVAAFRLRPGAAVAAFPADGAGRAAVDDAFLTLALPLALHLSGTEVLHASAVRGPRGVAGFCGFSGTGKTTVALGLARRGHALWGDDVVVLEPASGGVLAHQVPFRANVRAATREALALGDAPAPAGAGGATVPLGALVVLERVEDAGEAGVERLEAAQALPALLPHSFRFDLTEMESRRDTVRRYLAVVAAVPVLRARFVPSFGTLDALLDELEAALALA